LQYGWTKGKVLYIYIEENDPSENMERRHNYLEIEIHQSPCRDHRREKTVQPHTISRGYEQIQELTIFIAGDGTIEVAYTGTVAVNVEKHLGWQTLLGHIYKTWDMW
jgi:hypothetical protein